LIIIIKNLDKVFFLTFFIVIFSIFVWGVSEIVEEWYNRSHHEMRGPSMNDELKPYMEMRE